MDDGPSSFPIDLEPQVVHPQRRRHRAITAPSGLVLFVCLFLPAYRVCGSPAYPFELWPLATPYLLGGLVAVMALIGRPNEPHRLAAGIRALIWTTVIGWALYLLGLAATEGEVIPVLIWAPVGTVILGLYGRGHDERAAARTTIATAIVCAVWFGLFCFDPSALAGIYLSAGAAVAMLVGGLEWRREVLRDAAQRIPDARARQS
jgi:hypothetical protein